MALVGDAVAGEKADTLLPKLLCAVLCVRAIGVMYACHHSFMDRSGLQCAHAQLWSERLCNFSHTGRLLYCDCCNLKSSA